MAKKNGQRSATRLTTVSYLDRLCFDPRLLLSPVAHYINNLRLVALLVLTITLLGIVSYFELPKRLNPEVKIPIVTVVTVLPGASPDDVESLVTEPLENELRSAEGLDSITSVSNQNVSVITLQYLSSVDSDKAKDDTQSLVDSVTDLPEDAQDPAVSALDFEDQPVWTFVITSEGDPRTLMTFSEDLKDSLEELTKVDRVVTSGFESQEVVVKINPEKLHQLGLNPLLLSQSIQKSVSSYPAGTVENSSNAFSLTINPTLTSLRDLRNIQLLVQGQGVTLGQIAEVSEQPKPNQEMAFLAFGQKAAQRAVTFYVYKTSSADIDDTAQQVQEKVDEKLSHYGSTYTLTSLSNTSELISEQFTDLLGEFRSTILLVFVCLLVFLGLRQAIISSLTVPLTFLSAFIFMNILGMSINFLSLFAFLLALGLLVDDTIVVVSAMTTYFKSGRFSPLETGLLVWKDTIFPIWSTTITTIWSFVPLLLTSGIIGEFIKPIPIVVTVTMISSTAIAVLVTLPIMILILKPQVPGRVTVLLKILVAVSMISLVSFFLWGTTLLPVALVILAILGVFSLVAGQELKKQLRDTVEQNQFFRQFFQKLNHISDHGIINLDGFGQSYKRFIQRILSSKRNRRRVLLAIVAYSIIGFLLLPMGFVKNEFFPKTDSEVLYVNLEMPAGTTDQITQDHALTILDELRTVPDVEFVTAELGKNASGGFGGSASASNLALLTIRLPKEAERSRKSFEIAEQIRKQFENYTDGKLNVVEESGGPPAGADVQIELIGPELDQLNSYADQLVAYLETQSGTVNVQKSYKTGTTQLVFIPDMTKITEAGLSIDQVGLWLRMYASGFTLDSIDFDTQGTKKEDVVFRLSSQNAEVTHLGVIEIPNAQGMSYPLLSLGHLETSANPISITRKDGSRTITVTAAAAPGYNATQLNAELVKHASTIDLADGYSWQTGGANEENQESINSILQAMVISAVLILITMVIQFNSFRQAFIVLIVIPLAVSSVFWIFALTGTPLSFPSLIGVLLLFGIVVTNSMFIVDKINLNLKQGMEFKEAIADSGASRLEPIILTKLATVLGLLPITLADPLWRGLGGAIISGLLIASSIMLLFIPVVYYSLFNSKSLNHTK